jgi:hypothetical protein
VHTTEMLQGFTGIGMRSVRPVTGSKVPLLALTYTDGFVALLQLQMPFHEWSLNAFTKEGLRATTVSTRTLYEPFLRNFVALLKGERVDYSLAGPVEAVRVHLAARIALEKGTEILLDDLPADTGFDGRAFAAEYAASKRQQGTSTPQR